MRVRKWLPPWWVISIPTLCHASLASSCLFHHRAGAGSINWHISQFLMTCLISALATAGSMRFTKYSIHLMPGFPPCMWMSFICCWLIMLAVAAEVWPLGLTAIFTVTYHLWGSLALWCNQCYAVMSETKLFEVSSLCLISILAILSNVTNPIHNRSNSLWLVDPSRGDLYGQSGPSVWPLQLAPPVLLRPWWWSMHAQVIAQLVLLQCLWMPSIVVSPEPWVQPQMRIQKFI